MLYECYLSLLLIGWGETGKQDYCGLCGWKDHISIIALLIPGTADVRVLVQAPPQPRKKGKQSPFFIHEMWGWRCEVNYLPPDPTAPPPLPTPPAVKWPSQDSNPCLSPRCAHDTCASMKDLEREEDSVIISPFLWRSLEALPRSGLYLGLCHRLTVLLLAHHFPSLELNVPYWKSALCKPSPWPLFQCWYFHQLSIKHRLTFCLT